MLSDAADRQSSELQPLEHALERLLKQFDELQRRCVSAEERVQHLEAVMRNSSDSAGEVDPVALATRVHLLEQENRFLARRLDRARESVKRITARLQFLDEDR